MYESEAKGLAYNPQYPNVAVGSSQGGQIAHNASPPKPVLIADAVLKDLTIILEKARMVHNRQSILRDRIFGSRPSTDGENGKACVSSNSFLSELNEKLQALHAVMDSIIETQTEFERLA